MKMFKMKKFWNLSFNKYMEEMINHPNYTGLPINHKKDGTIAWVVMANSQIGQDRKKWAEEKAIEFNLPIKAGVYARVMRMLHPTKIHICQICGSEMSIFYHYPSANFIKSITKEFGYQFTCCDHISDIWDQIIDLGVEENRLKQFFLKSFDLFEVINQNKDQIIALCETQCRENGKKLLSPGVMSNFPDRFDGFHTYNICCRSKHDKGRSYENLKTYTKDRRAYEYWSDGNLHAANMFMGSHFFRDSSADHVGPISLGFVHDSHYLRRMSRTENSTKRDRLSIEDIEIILDIESKTRINPISWYSAEIWAFIKLNYKQNPELIASTYRDMLKQNMANYMFILNKMMIDANENAYIFLKTEFIEPKYEGFAYTYEFDDHGHILNKSERRLTERMRNEKERLTRIAFDAILEYHQKDNRHMTAYLDDIENKMLDQLCIQILNGDFSSAREHLKTLVKCIEQRMIRTMITVQSD